MSMSDITEVSTETAMTAAKLTTHKQESCLMNSKHSRIPRFITSQFAGGAQEFRVNHRHALRMALKALRNARFGCAYSPAFKAIQRANHAINEAIEAARPTNWERRLVRRPTAK